MKQQDFTAEECIWTPEKEAEYRAQKAENAELRAEVELLRSHNALLKKALYGAKTEKTEAVMDGGEQLNLFNEAEAERDDRRREKEEPIVVAAHTRKKKRTHAEMGAGLRVEEIVHTVSEEERLCPECGSEMTVAGKEFVRDEIIYVPAELFVRKHYIEVLKCVSCGKDERKDAFLPDIEQPTFKKGIAPSPLLPRSFASPSLLAHIAYEKFCNGMPLYRQEKDLGRLDLYLSRATMANWIIESANKILKPIWEEQKKILLSGTVIHADETVVEVLKEPGRKPTAESRMWVYCNGEIGSPSNILFDYKPGRSGSYATDFLKGFGGYLVCDGYAGYNQVPDVTRCACFAHVRRKFVEALPVKKEEIPESCAAIGVNYCNRLFELERQFAEISPKERQEERQKQERPVLDAFFVWLDGINAPARTKLSVAVEYTKKLKTALYAYLENPMIPISNNRAENAIRPFVVGRKQWLFSDSVRGAEASAVYYSLVSTACANGLNPYRYLEHLFNRFNQSQPSELLAWNPDLIELCK